MATTVKFFGLCGIGSFGGDVLAAMPAVGSHKAVMAVAARECVLDGAVKAAPDFIGYDAKGVQMLCWNIGTKEVKFSGASGKAVWGTKADLIDLGYFHPSEPIKKPSGAAIVQLHDGSLSNGPEKEKYKVKKNGAVLDDKAFSISVTWQGEGEVLEAGGSKFVQLKTGATVVFSNLTADPNGHHHFHHYYDTCFATSPAPNDQVTISEGTALTLSLEVFDCVPAVPLP